MGNCLVLQASIVRIMKPDGKVLEYKIPIKVHQILNQFSNHAISESQSSSVPKHLLHPNTKLLKGRLYYLLPLPPPNSPKAASSKKKVRFAEPEVESGAVRIKVVISKQELQHMVLQKGGVLSVNDMLSKVIHCEEDVCRKNEDGSSPRWKPALQSIPEIN